MTPDQQSQLEQRALAELDRSTTAHLLLDLAAPDALALISQIQIAARHPQNSGYARAAAHRVVNGLVEQLLALGYRALAEVAELGWHAQNDVPYDASARKPSFQQPNPSRN